MGCYELQIDVIGMSYLCEARKVVAPIFEAALFIDKSAEKEQEGFRRITRKHIFSVNDSVGAQRLGDGFLASSLPKYVKWNADFRAALSSATTPISVFNEEDNNKGKSNFYHGEVTLCATRGEDTLVVWLV